MVDAFNWTGQGLSAATIRSSISNHTFDISASLKGGCLDGNAGGLLIPPTYMSGSTLAQHFVIGNPFGGIFFRNQ